MTRSCWVVLFALLFAATMCSAAGMAGRPYVGGGLLYSIERFGDDVTDGDDILGEIDFENTWGLFAKGGYFVSDLVAIEALARYHHEYKADQSGSMDLGYGLGGASEQVSVKVKEFDLTLNVKGFLPVSGQFLPYGVLGAGYARFTTDLDDSFQGLGQDETVSESETDSGPLARIGAGCDYFFSDNIGVEGEITYNRGFSDIKGADFIDITIGAIYAF